MSKNQPKLVIIDGNALIHRSFHALPPTLRTKNGQLVNAAYGFTAFLLKSLNEFRPEYVVLTLDMAGPTFRHESYADYKATRTKAPDELYEQIPIVKDIAHAFNIPIFEKSGFEADDLIGTIITQTTSEKNLQKIIITGDLDALQLIDEQTKVYTMSRGLSESVLYGPEEVMARYGLRPDQIIDYKALRGDPSDNIPGVRGVGEKTACELIKEFESLDGVYEAARKHHSKIKPRINDLLLSDQNNAYLSRQLASIDRSVPLSFSLDDIKFSSFQLEPVLDIFQKLEFRSLLIKVKELRDKLDNNWTTKSSINLPSGHQETKPTPRLPAAKKNTHHNYQLIGGLEKLELLLKEAAKQNPLALAITSTGPDPVSDQLTGLALSWKKGEAFYIKAVPRALEKIRPILENPKLKKYGHNLKNTWRFLSQSGLSLQGLAFDSMIAAYLLEPSNRQNNLSALAFTELGLELQAGQSEASGQKQLSLDLESQSDTIIGRSACEEADLVLQLSNIQIKKIKQAELETVLNTIEIPLIPVLGKMENKGISVDQGKLKNLEKTVAKKIALLEKDIYSLAGEKFNINSTKQLKEILFEKLRISTDNIKKTKTGFSTAEDELLKLRDRHPIISLIQDHRELSKLQSTYLQALPKMINSQTDRIHTNFNQTVAATGRLSSNDPNLQNIPVKTEEGQKVRTAFTAEPGWKLVAFDYSQIELRLAAHMSRDKKMIEAFQTNTDIHAATAATINGVPLDQVTAKMRREAKAINFGILYGQGPHGLSQGAGISYAEASDFIKKYFQAYPGIKQMMDGFISIAREKGYAETLLGRRRPLPELNSTIPMVRKAAERMAINTPLQGTAADIIKLAMINIADWLSNCENDIHLLLQVHDELIFEIREDKVDEYAPAIKDLMEKPLPLKVPVVVDKKQGQDWGSLK